MNNDAIQVEGFGVDWTGDTSCYDDDDDNAIVVPITTCSVAENDFSMLKRQIDLMEGCDDYGRGLYVIDSYSVCIGSCQLHVVYFLWLLYY